jgi:hypothetical protein
MQVAGVNSVRDITNKLRSATGNFIHFGVTRAPSKSSVSYQNKQRTYEVFMDLYLKLLEKYEPSLSSRRKYAKRLKRKIFIMDFSIIPLCLSLFDWAKFRTKKGGLKLHAVMNYDTGQPSCAHITDAKQHDVREAKNILFPKALVLVLDRVYVAYKWLFNLNCYSVIFVTGLKANADIKVVESFLTSNKQEQILSDEDIRLKGFYSAQNYPDKLRIVKVYYVENGRLSNLITFLRMNVFVKIDLWEWVNNPILSKEKPPPKNLLF